ncbi:hypothetical protein CANARDRAFT_29874 [[Candida] arabinofermentans NRRL YB-2248]|uniref:Uncharacterized protein n=1 Tax=[Candida] arabinofermentans NRRL YB-2248 TaxID=983967 RepID=A0A1E4SW13_9ASCO|nr:hypothetical protein CANARDRAFT_29874 [[Candida] arabinofermentans NRRL YB-2248]
MEKKNSLVYTSQGIDLTHLDDDEDDDGDVSMIEPKKEESTKPLSKTATRVLNILNGDTDLVNEKKPVVEKEQEKLKEPIKSDSKVTTNINGFTFSKSNSPANPAGSVSQVQTPTNVTKPVSVFQQTTTIKAPTPAFSINSMLNGKEDVKESKNNDIEIIDLDDESDEDDEVYNEEEEEEEEEDDEEEEEEQDEEEEEQEEEEEEEEEVEEVKQDQASEGNLHKSAPAISILPSVSSSNGLNIKPSTNGTAIASISNSNSTPLTTTKEVIEEFTFPDVEMADPELLKKLDENLEEYYRSVFIF